MIQMYCCGNDYYYNTCVVRCQGNATRSMNGEPTSLPNYNCTIVFTLPSWVRIISNWKKPVKDFGLLLYSRSPFEGPRTKITGNYLHPLLVSWTRLSNISSNSDNVRLGGARIYRLCFLPTKVTGRLIHGALYNYPKPITPFDQLSLSPIHHLYGFLFSFAQINPKQPCNYWGFFE